MEKTSIVNNDLSEFVNTAASEVIVKEKEPTVVSWRRYLIGPVLAVYMFGYMMSYYTIVEYTNKTWLDKKLKDANITLNNSASSRCEANKSSPEFITEQDATSTASTYVVYYSLAQGIPAVVSNLILGSYTDAFGRKFLLGVGISGTTIRLILSMFIIYFKMDLLYFIGACVIEGCTGQYATMLQVCLAYTGDTTKPGKKRAIGMAYIMLMLGTSFSLASLCAGYLIQIFNFYVPFAVAAILLIFSFIAMVIFLPESLPVERRIKNKKLSSVLYNSVSFFISKDTQNNRWKYQLLLAAHGFCDFSFLGRVGTETIYQMSEPFCWSAEQVGWYGAVRTFGMMIFGVGSVKVFQVCLPDVSIAMIGVLSYCSCFLLTAFSYSSPMLYIAGALSVFGPLESTIIRSLASSLTDSQQQGAIFSAFAAVEIIVNLLSNVGTSTIYSVSVSFMRGFVFLILASFDAIAAFLLAILLVLWRREERTVFIEKI